MAKTAKPEDNPAPRKTGRPSKYTEELANEILTRIANGESMVKILKGPGMPTQTCVYEWLQKMPSFAEKYTRAREDQADTLADEIQAIADETPELNPVYDKNGELIKIEMHNAYIQWQRNRIDARKWIASKLKPKKYSDRLMHAGDADSPLQVKADVSIFDAMLKNLEAKRQLGDQ